jgi:magnesium-transporting ATPase (P-type)
LSVQGKENMLFAGTSIAYGSGVGIVTAIGMDTELGQIHAQIQEASEFEEDTPLKQKLNEFGELLAQVQWFVGGALPTGALLPVRGQQM